MHSLTKIKFDKSASDRRLDRIIDRMNETSKNGSVNRKKKTLEAGRLTVKKYYKNYYDSKSHLYDLEPGKKIGKKTGGSADQRL